MFDHACHDRRDGDGEAALHEAAETVDYEMISARSSTHAMGSATSDKQLGQLAFNYKQLWDCGHRKTIHGAGLPDPTKPDFMAKIRLIHAPNDPAFAAAIATLPATSTAPLALATTATARPVLATTATITDTTEDSSSQVCHSTLTARRTIPPPT